MALGAMAHYPGLNVKIVPCGMNYFHPDKFRSRAVVEYGKPITITQDLVEKFKQGGADKREACSELLSTVSDALKAVTLNTPDYETLMVIQAARRLYRPKNKKFKITRVTELNRRLVAGYLHYKDEPRIQEIKTKVLDYNKQLRTFGIRDHQVKNTTLSRLRASFRLFRRVIGLMFMAVLALPGSILASPIIIAASIVSKQKQKEALATSSVKIRAKDVISSWKILIALGLGPLVYTIYSVIITYLVSYMNINRFFVWITPIISIIILPMITYISLIFGERGFDIYRSLPPLFLCMLGDPAVKTLPQTREELSNEITAIINDLGPQLFPELDHTRTFDEHNNEYTPLTPGSVNALNWIMSPFELIGERLFSDYSDAENGTSLSRNTSYTDLPKLAPLSSLSSSNIKLKLNKHEDILSDNINVEPPSPITQTGGEQTPIEDKKDI
jgi:glycerol-3-phosphate O-acyltransferase/dihydroxyacetone phosphate acyltransferase